MTRFRYRTSVLTGPWRESPDAALVDAIRARQVLYEENEPTHYRWVVPGRIEEDSQQERRRSIGG